MIACVCVYAPTVNAVQHVVSTVPHRHHNGFYIINVPSKTRYMRTYHYQWPYKRRITVPQRQITAGANDIAHNPCSGAQTNKLLIQRRAPGPWGHTATAVLDVYSFVSVDSVVDPASRAVKPTFVVLPTRAFVVLPTRAFVVLPTRAFVVLPTRAYVVLPTRAFVVLPTRTYVALPTRAKR